MEINKRKTEKVVEIGPIDISGIKADILALPPDSWNDEDSEKANYNKAGILRQTQHIVFRFSDKRKMPVTYFDLPLWEKWKDRLQPVMDAATKHFNYPNGFYPRVMLAKLPPGARIAPHTDGNVRQNRPHKIHIAIQTNADAFFFQFPEKYNFKEGIAYEVNNAVMHGVENNGTTDRIHLIFEYLEQKPQV